MFMAERYRPLEKERQPQDAPARITGTGRVWPDLSESATFNEHLTGSSGYT
jgi:hypothetical protein